MINLKESNESEESEESKNINKAYKYLKDAINILHNTKII